MVDAVPASLNIRSCVITVALLAFLCQTWWGVLPTRSSVVLCTSLTVLCCLLCAIEWQTTRSLLRSTSPPLSDSERLLRVIGLGWDTAPHTVSTALVALYVGLLSSYIGSEYGEPLQTITDLVQRFLLTTPNCTAADK